MSDTQDIEPLVHSYVSIRAARERLEAEWKEKDKALEVELKAIEAALLSVHNALGADSIKTASGTAMRRIIERSYCTDWGAFRKFEIDNLEYDFRERRIHQGNMREYMKEHTDAGLPPGVNLSREYSIVVRKA